MQRRPSPSPQLGFNVSPVIGDAAGNSLNISSEHGVVVASEFTSATTSVCVGSGEGESGRYGLCAGRDSSSVPPSTVGKATGTTFGAMGGSSLSSRGPSALIPSPTAPSSPMTSLEKQFPFLQKVLICNVLLVDSTADSMLFSYVGLLVAHLDPNFSRSSAGYFSGVLLGLYQASQFFALPRWGRMSDAIGRKPVLQTSLVLCCFVSLFFGSSTSLLQALVARIIHGSVIAGNITIKSYVAETTTEKTAAAAFSMVALARAVGGAIGPLVGGLLYDPTSATSPLSHYFRGPKNPRSSLSLTDDGGSFWYHLFKDRPALLPAMALAVYAIVVLAMVCLWLKESNPNVLLGRGKAGFGGGDKAIIVTPMTIITMILRGAQLMVVEWGRSSASLWSWLVGRLAGRRGVVRGAQVTPSPPPTTALTAKQLQSVASATINMGSSSSARRHQQNGVGIGSTDALDNVSIVSKASTLSALTNNSSFTSPTSPRTHPHNTPQQANTTATDGGGERLGCSETIQTAAVAPNSSAAAVAAIPESYSPAAIAHLPLADQLAAANAYMNSLPAVGYADVWSHPVLKVLTPMYAALTSFNIWFMEVFPLYCIAYRRDGGLGLESTQVSVLLTMVAVSNFVGNLFFSKMVALVGVMRLWRWGCFLSALTIATTPIVGSITDERTSFTVIAALFVVPTVVRVFTTIWCFSMNTMFFTNVAPKKHLGAVTSMSYASGAGARALAPMIASPIFAWSVSSSSSAAVAKEVGSASNASQLPTEYISFVLCAAIAMLCLVLSLRLDSALVGKRHP